MLLQYDPTIEESYQTTIDIEGKAMQVEILDTAGQDAYTPLRETFMHTGDGFLLVYSIVDDQTLEELREIREQILRVHPDRKVRTAHCIAATSPGNSQSLPSAHFFLGAYGCGGQQVRHEEESGVQAGGQDPCRRIRRRLSRDIGA